MSDNVPEGMAPLAGGAEVEDGEIPNAQPVNAASVAAEGAGVVHDDPMDGVEHQDGGGNAVNGGNNDGTCDATVSGTNAVSPGPEFILAMERLTQALLASTSLARPTGSVDKTGERAIKKQLFDAFPAPDKDTWSAETSHKFCDAVGKYLAAREIDLNSKDSANWGFRCLPEAVQIQITPAGTEVHPLWAGAVAFESWRGVLQAIKNKYGTQAQQRILTMLQELRMQLGKVKAYKQEFFRLLKELEPGYMPSNNELLNLLQDAMYSLLAEQEAVKWSPSADNIPVAWKPDQYAKLMDVCVSVDDALAAKAAKKGVNATGKPASGASKPKGDSSTPITKGPKRKFEGGEGGPAYKRVAFKDIKFASAEVTAAQKAGHCINCLKPGHISSKCPEPRVKRERAPDCPSRNKGGSSGNKDEGKGKKDQGKGKK
jgi:hypothetical protein